MYPMANPKPLLNPAPASSVVRVRDAVAVGWVDGVFPWAMNSVKCSEARGWRTDIILKPNPHPDWAADSAGQVHRVKVTQRFEGGLPAPMGCITNP